MTRRTIAALTLAGALTGPAAAADPGAPALHARPSVEAIAPGGNITSIQEATAARGWPHRPDVNERIDVTRLMLALYAPTGRASARCTFGATMGAPIRCTVTRPRAVVTLRIGLPAVRDRHGRIVRPRIPGVWEDGSYRVTTAVSSTRTPAQETAHAAQESAR